MALSNRINFRGGQNVDNKFYIFKNGVKETLVNGIAYNSSYVNDGAVTIGATIDATVSTALHTRGFGTASPYVLTDKNYVCVEDSTGQVYRLTITDRSSAMHISVGVYNNNQNVARLAITTSATVPQYIDTGYKQIVYLTRPSNTISITKIWIE